MPYLPQRVTEASYRLNCDINGDFQIGIVIRGLYTSAAVDTTNLAHRADLLQRDREVPTAKSRETVYQELQNQSRKLSPV
jgi:hypothetical protein